VDSCLSCPARGGSQVRRATQLQEWRCFGCGCEPCGGDVDGGAASGKAGCDYLSPDVNPPISVNGPLARAQRPTVTSIVS
jgi:hypothetical protein